MAGHVEDFGPPSIVALLWQHNSLDCSVAIDGVDLYTDFEIASECNDLYVVCVHIELLHFTDAEACDVPTHEVLVKDCVFLQEAGRQPSDVHNKIVRTLVVAQKVN